ncbi:DUF1232 domain-containing protein [Streptomyces sp. JJ66]|uniref:YkvA family protein n=1 Tax=Streptomyces sp. JJ66 TaxID=2803843 RepID=UPI001C590C12|nr:YkvA family protein [Streptomyces sp. JJ66]MBW1602815.1 DUF1232 domain-containing protein [Streptomyces sp. JJ66]
MSTESWVVLTVAAALVVVTVVFAVRLLVQVVKARSLLREAGVPVSNKLAYWGALVYVISPVDLMPDPVLLDDIGVLLLALRSLHTAAEAAGLRPGRSRQAPNRPAPRPVTAREKPECAAGEGGHT